jgi:hypothetical protein
MPRLVQGLSAARLTVSPREGWNWLLKPLAHTTRRCPPPMIRCSAQVWPVAEGQQQIRPDGNGGVAIKTGEPRRPRAPRLEAGVRGEPASGDRPLEQAVVAFVLVRVGDREVGDRAVKLF